MGRTLVDGAVVRFDLTNAGFGTPYITENDDPGTVGQIPMSQGPGLPWAMVDFPATSDGIVDYTRFNISGTWNKPTGPNFGPNSPVLIRQWGGGAGGAGNSSGGSGGGGGGYIEKWSRLSDLPSSVTVTIGAGGASVTNNTTGNSGGATSFGSVLPNADGGGPTATAGSNGLTNAAVYDGGAGGTNAPTGGQSVMWGGGGGGGASSSAAGAAGGSVNGGNGGAGGINGANGGAGSQPGGGGGGVEFTASASSGAGGNGSCEVIVWPFPA